MVRKWVTIFLLSVLVFTSPGCYTARFQDIETQGVLKAGPNNQILGLVTMDDEWLEFSPLNLGKIIEGNIVGLAQDLEGKRKMVSIPLSGVKKVWIKKFDPLEGLLQIFEVIGTAGVAFIPLYIF